MQKRPQARPPLVAAASAALGLGVALLGVACGGGNLASQLAKPPEFAPKDQAKCGVTKSQAHPLIVEWPSADRAELESQARHGLVAVHYVGCEMEVLAQCRAPGKYAYTGTTRKHDRVTMKDADELYANIPAYAAKFEGKLATTGQLNVAMTIVGQYDADKAAGLTLDDLVGGDCAGATHVVSALTTGAFEFFAGASADVGAGVTSVTGAGARARSNSEHETLNQDGDEKSCEKATSKDHEPPEGCGALIRVEVVPLGPRDPSRAGAKKDPDAAAVASVKSSQGDCPDGMASLPGGAFRVGLGAPVNRTSLAGDAGPSQRVVAPFCMDVSEVTAEQFTGCVKDGKCDAAGLSCGAGASYGVATRQSFPINCVAASQADAFCAAQGKRLPSEQEWEWAARGGNQAFKYPWGMDDGYASKACVGAAAPCEVGKRPSGDSPQGIHDLIGNVWEWTSSTSEQSRKLRVIRGGAFNESRPELFAVATSRVPDKPDDHNVNLGFRCVK